LISDKTRLCYIVSLFRRDGEALRFISSIKAVRLLFVLKTSNVFSRRAAFRAPELSANTLKYFGVYDNIHAVL
jgi:hypothetical protein